MNKARDENEKWILAAKYKSEFYPEYLVKDPDQALGNLEYIDIREGEYQLWHWPSGDIYEVIPDREVESGNEYSVSYDKTGVVWLPILKKKYNNLEMVKDAVGKFATEVTNMTRPLDIDELKSNLTNQLKHIFPVHRLKLDPDRGSFIADTDEYILEVVLSEREVSYSFELKTIVNKFKLGIFSAADYAPFIGDPELERVALSVYDELKELLDTIDDGEVYVGKSDSKSAYIAWRNSNEYTLKKYKRTFFGGMMTTEKTINEAALKGLNLARVGGVKQ